MNLSAVSKAIAGAAAGGLTSLATSFVVIPDSVVMPWYGYVLVGLINAAIGFGFVYFAPRNTA